MITKTFIPTFHKSLKVAFGSESFLAWLRLKGAVLYAKDTEVDRIGVSSADPQQGKYGVFNGTSDYVPLLSTVTLVGDFTVKFSSSAGALAMPLGAIDFVEVTADKTRVRIDGINYDFAIGPVSLGETIISRVDDQLTVTYSNGNTHTVTCTTVDMSVSYIGRRNAGNYFDGYLWNVYVEDSTGVKFHYPYPTEVGSDAIWYDISGNGDHATASVASTAAHCQESVEYGYSVNVLGYSEGRWSNFYQGYIDEETRTNKCTCVKANPTDTTGLTKTGDAAATITVVDDSDELAAGGLDHICNGNVYKLDNSAGSATAFVSLSGTTGNTNKHSGSVYYRTVGGQAIARIGSTNDTAMSHVASYTRFIFEDKTPSSSSATLNFYIAAGYTLYFILPQLEEDSTSTSIIIGDDTAAVQTAVNGLFPALADGTNFDALGNPLQYPGPIKQDLQPYDKQVATFDGTSSEIAVASLVGTETVTSYTGTGTPSITAGKIECTAGTLGDLLLSNGYLYPLEESSGTTVYGYHTTTGAVLTGTISTADINAFWGGTVDAVKSHGSTYGYRLSGSVHIPANPLTGLACDGNSLTNPAGFLNDSQKWAVPETREMWDVQQAMTVVSETLMESDGTPIPRDYSGWTADPLDGTIDPSPVNDDQIFVGNNQMTIMAEPQTGGDITKLRIKHGVE